MLQNGRVELAVQGALKFYGQIAYYDQFSGLVLDGSEGDRLAEALDNKQILFLSNHGIIIVGKNVAHDLNDLYYLEQACRAQITALSSGKPLKIISEEIAQNTFAQM
jgi:ribulose-5-phosphate 4-epimerase/fuculose-1-phosphate aldolase